MGSYEREPSVLSIVRAAPKGEFFADWRERDRVRYTWLMALYEYHCQDCRLDFEQLTSSRDPDQGKCPKCHKNNTKRLISRFRVAGQGDLRESTWDGCHSPSDPHGHSHDHDHGDGEGHGSGSGD